MTLTLAKANLQKFQYYNDDLLLVPRLELVLQ